MSDQEYIRQNLKSMQKDMRDILQRGSKYEKREMDAMTEREITSAMSKQHGKAALSQNQQLIPVGKVEQRVVEHHDGVLILLQQLHETRLIAGLVERLLAVLSDQMLYGKPRQFLIISKNILHIVFVYSAAKVR